MQLCEDGLHHTPVEAALCHVLQHHLHMRAATLQHVSLMLKLLLSETEKEDCSKLTNSKQTIDVQKLRLAPQIVLIIPQILFVVDRCLAPEIMQCTRGRGLTCPQFCLRESLAMRKLYQGILDAT